MNALAGAVQAAGAASRAAEGADALIVTNYYFPEPTGSAPPITDLALWLAEQGANIRVVTARPSYPQNRVFDGYAEGERDRETDRGVDVTRVKSYVAPGRGFAGRVRSELSFALAAVRARLAGRTAASKDVICFCPSVFTIAAALMFRAPGGRVMCVVHDIQSGLAKSLGFGMNGAALRVLQGMEAFFLNRCDVVVALSQGMADELAALGVTKPVRIFPPQVDVREIRPQPEPQGAPLLLYSGNLGRKQGLDQVLDLAGELLRRGSPARILVRGQGSERGELEAAAAERRLTNIAFADLAPRAQLSEALGEAVIHLAPQNPDGASFAVPSKIFSIMAAERPFVATAREGAPLWRIVQESGAGLCADPYDVAAFADAVESLLADEAGRRARARQGRRYVEDHIDREVVCLGLWNAVHGPDPQRA